MEISISRKSYIGSFYTKRKKQFIAIYFILLQVVQPSAERLDGPDRWSRACDCMDMAHCAYKRR